MPGCAMCEGLVKLVGREELKAHDWSLTPGRYVGVAPEEVDENFDFEEALRSIHIDLKGLNEEATQLAARIAKNFEEMGYEPDRAIGGPCGSAYAIVVSPSARGSTSRQTTLQAAFPSIVGWPERRPIIMKRG